MMPHEQIKINLKNNSMIDKLPEFDHNHVLPPHLGNPASDLNISPYEVSIRTFCERFATSKSRIEILKGFIGFRLRLVSLGVTDGYQWVDGSFVEDIETSEGRSPNDIDVVTLYWNLDKSAQYRILSQFNEFGNHSLSKMNYLVDHYPFDIAYNPLVTVQQTKYWYQLFSHNRKGVWKGIVQIPLYKDSSPDTEALTYLNTL